MFKAPDPFEMEYSTGGGGSGGGSLLSSGTEARRQFVLMPATGIRSADMAKLASNLASNSESFARAVASRLGIDTRIRILNSQYEDGPKLVEMTDPGALALQDSHPGIRAYPWVSYELAKLPKLDVQPTMQPAAAGIAPSLRLTVRGKKSSRPIEGAEVIALTDFKKRIGAKAISDSQCIQSHCRRAMPALDC